MHEESKNHLAAIICGLSVKGNALGFPIAAASVKTTVSKNAKKTGTHVPNVMSFPILSQHLVSKFICHSCESFSARTYENVDM